MRTLGVGLTDVGQQRDHNEDAFLVDNDLGLFLVCDGMGGEAAGEVASAYCTKNVQRRFQQMSELFEQYASEPDPETRALVVRAVSQAVEKTSAEIHATAKADKSKQGMGTTLVLMLVMGRHAVLAHVGDSRIYLVRNGEVHQLTEDQTQAMELVKQGIISREEADRSPLANVITQAVGHHESIEVETLHIELTPGDTYLLCSDGLSNYVGEEDLARCLSELEPESAARELIEIANRVGKDNITAVVLRSAMPNTGVDLGVDAERKLQALKQIPLFQHMTFTELQRVLNVASLQRFAAGSFIIREGDLDFVFYVLLHGQVKVLKDRDVVATLNDGVHFGEMCLVDESPRSASIVADVDCMVLALERQALFGLINREQAVAVKILWGMCRELSQRLRRANESLSGARRETQRLQQAPQPASPGALRPGPFGPVQTAPAPQR